MPATQDHTADRSVPWSIQDIVEAGFLGLAILSLGFMAAQGLGYLFPNVEFLYIYGPLVLMLYCLVFLLVQRLGPMRHGLSLSDSLHILGFRNFRLYHFPLAFAALIAAYFLEGAYAYLVRLFFGVHNIDPGVGQLRDVFGTSAWGLAAALILVSIVAPVVEETIFRGFLFAGLRNYFPVIFSASASALVFALFHMSLLSLVPIFILGLFLAYLYEMEGSLYPSIFFHAMNNTVAILVVYYFSPV